MKRLLSEPLVHFLLVGVILFGVYAYKERGHGGVGQPKQIQLTIDDLSQMVLLFRSQWRRDPTPEELRSLVEDKVHEEVLYREALALGIDKDDTIVKRRMAQKMQFLSEDVAAAREPATKELVTWYQANRDQFASPPRVSFRHLYFSPDRRGAHARDDAAAALTKLAGQPEDSNLAASLADPFMFQQYYRDRAPEFLGKEFGPNFALAVAKFSPGSWQGPVESGFGWHLVFVDTLIPGSVPAFEEVEADVKIAWLAEQKVQAWQKTYQDMRAKYMVLLPAPAEGASETGETSRSKQGPAVSGGRGS
jgi:peptidyl-prolyl cis-trans isomerase C